MSAWDTPKSTCPYCGNKECEADWCNVEVGMVQCGPYVCRDCGASEIGPFDENTLTETEKEKHWFEPGHFGTTANTYEGVHIDHKTTLDLYRVGLLQKDRAKKN